MPLYDFKCGACNMEFEVEKRMADPNPDACPGCGAASPERMFSPSTLPAMAYANRPIWTYKECKGYKTCTQNGSEPMKIDPSKHGDLGSWHCTPEPVSGKNKVV